MRQALDRLYAAGLVLSAIAMVTIAVMVLAQVLGRITDRTLLWMGRDAIGLAVPSLAEIGGFLFVASAFLALPATLKAGNHVRVTLLAQAIRKGPVARVMEVLVLIGAAALAGFATWNSGLQVLDSWQFGSVSFGMVRVPLWLPQGAMTAGLALFLICLLDELMLSLSGRTPAFRAAEQARSQTGGGATDGH